MRGSASNTPADIAEGEADPASRGVLESDLYAFLEVVPAAAVTVDDEGHIVQANARAEALFGYTRTELVGQPVEILLPEGFRSAHLAHRAGGLADLSTGPMGRGRDLAGRAKDGHEFPVEIGLTSTTSAGKVLVTAFIMDISERKRAERALQHTAQRLEALHAIDRAILAAQPPEEIAGVALGYLCQLVPCLHTSALVFDPDAGDAVVLFTAGAGIASLAPGKRFSMDQLPMLHELGDGRPYVERDLADLGHLTAIEGVLLHGGAAAYVSVPLLFRGTLIGVLHLALSAAGALDREHLEIAREVAGLLTVALQQARLRESLQEYTSGLEQRVAERTREVEQRHAIARGLRDILAVLNTNRPLGEILDQIVMQAHQLLGAAAVAIYRLDEKQGMLRVQAAHGLAAAVVPHLTIPLGQGAVGQAAAGREPVLIVDPQAVFAAIRVGDGGGPDARLRAALQRAARRYRAVLAVPLFIKGKLYGGISLYYREPQPVAEEAIELAVTFADQAALAIENADLREQSQASAAAAERSRLAHDLHDVVTQTLFSANLVAEILPGLWQRDPEEGQQRLQELRQLMRGALAEMRTLLLELRPAALVQVRLHDLLRQLSDAAAGQTFVPITLTVEEAEPLPPDVRIALYRIAQEALNNIAKHAEADAATVTLRRPGGGAELRVCDDGQGFDPGKVGPTQLGLGIMRERAESIGATLRITSRPNHGTEVLVVWPGSPVERTAPSKPARPRRKHR